MTVLVAPVLGVLAHVVHYTLVLGGAVVVVVLLFSTRPGRRPRMVTAHERRVEELRAAAGSGMLATPLGATAPLAVTTPVTTPITTPITTPVTTIAPPPPAAPPRTGTTAPPGTTAVIVAVVSSAAAAAVHAAAAPVHVREGLLVGGFFVVAALAQLAWSVLVLARGADRGLLLAGLLGNASIVALWAWTRTVGLPAGLGGAEPVGAWDAAATTWELVVVGCCAVALTGEFARGTRGMIDRVRWSAAARAWLVGSVLVLVVLTFTGAPA